MGLDGDQVNVLKRCFDGFADEEGAIPADNVGNILSMMGLKVKPNALREIIEEIDEDGKLYHVVIMSGARNCQVLSLTDYICIVSVTCESVSQSVRLFHLPRIGASRIWRVLPAGRKVPHRGGR